MTRCSMRSLNSFGNTVMMNSNKKKRMRNQDRKKGRGVFLSRDSGGKHENTPAEYVRWAVNAAAELGVAFSGTPQAIEEMIRLGHSVCGDLFFDDGVSGNELSRPALDALQEAVRKDKTISHVFIPRRDRF